MNVCGLKRHGIKKTDIIFGLVRLCFRHADATLFIIDILRKPLQVVVKENEKKTLKINSKEGVCLVLGSGTAQDRKYARKAPEPNK